MAIPHTFKAAKEKKRISKNPAGLFQEKCTRPSLWTELRPQELLAGPQPQGEWRAEIRVKRPAPAQGLQGGRGQRARRLRREEATRVLARSESGTAAAGGGARRGERPLRTPTPSAPPPQTRGLQSSERSPAARATSPRCCAAAHARPETLRGGRSPHRHQLPASDTSRHRPHGPDSH